ncbi:tigger transposable element-derived protein 1-like [Dendropsophus ebraccatus]|uniref:tigger transposable element-derived protein 1-like n=1 Tax=Dendropsophus ebraccatus TaxID=150705 RepID=UPI003831E19C
MPPKKRDTKDGKRRKKIRTTIELKKEIVAKFEQGVRVCELVTQYGMAKSTVSTILKQIDAIKEADVAKGVTTLTKQRPQTMERLLLMWIIEKQVAGDSVSEAMISHKALQVYADLTRDTPGTSGEAETFKANHGWFDNFKKRSGIHSVVRHGEAASANKEAAEQFASEFKAYIETEGFVPQQVFNCDETGLF